MTLLHALLIGSHAVALGAGWYGHYKYGSTVAAAAAKVKSVV